MPISVRVQLHFDTKDPRVAVAECVRLVREKTVGLGDAVVDVLVSCMANGEVLQSLAERLPFACLGFKVSGPTWNRTLSAGEFLAQGVFKVSSFSGILTEHFLVDDAFALVEQLLQSSAQAVRSTSFSLYLQQLHWKGAPADWIGSFFLMDLKGRGRAQRFSVSARLLLPGENPESPEFRARLKAVADATGIGFDKGVIKRVAGTDAPSPGHAQALLVGQVCFEEVLESVAAQLPTRWISEFAPNALASHDAFQRRMAQWGDADSGKVNLAPLVKRAAKRVLPEFKFEKADGNEISFTKRLGPDTELVVAIIKGMRRIGKAFTLVLGVRRLSEFMVFTTGVFALERTTEKKTWIYANAAEAEAAVDEAMNLAKEILPLFEAAVRQFFEPWPEEFPSGIERHGPLTARQAFAKAEKLARDSFSDAALIRVRNDPRSLAVRDIEGAELSFDGRLVPNAEWLFHFYSAEKDTSFQVTVPAIGRIRLLDHGGAYDNEITRSSLVPVDQDWIDSDRALALAEERGGRERRNSGKLFGLLAKLQMSPSQRTYWAFLYLITDERGRNDLIVNLDAATGEPLDDIQGF